MIARLSLAALLAAALLSPTPPAAAQDARQRAEIAALVQEMDYLIARAGRMARRYGRDAAPVSFDYGALVAQLRLTRSRAEAYLNESHALARATPPRPESGSLTRRR
ncbi:MAG: hypothetical protein IPK64_22035 [bacterium]|nr:hypothetical protein [bacterium]